MHVLIGCESIPYNALIQYPWRTLDGQPPVIIANHTDPGDSPDEYLYKPPFDHSYSAISDIEYVQINIAATKDGVPISSHAIHLSDTTDVASRPEFESRKRLVNGREDWYIFDFTYEELKELRFTLSRRTERPARSWWYVKSFESALVGITQWHDRSQTINTTLRYNSWDDEYRYPTGALLNILDPEIHNQSGIDIESSVIRVIEQLMKSHRLPPVVIQYSDVTLAHKLTANTTFPIVMQVRNAVDLDELPATLYGVVVNKESIQIIDGRSELIEEAHRRGLFIFARLFRDDQLDGTGYESGQKEIEAYLRAGVDGVLTDYPLTGLDARQAIVDQWVAIRTEADK
jgi:glycerophosphoryl diester phosphodiesterase